MPRFTPAQLEAARDRLVTDVVAPDLRVLFCGINPGLMTAATGHHFARPGNRFWPVLHLSGFTPRLLEPAEQQELLSYGLGITNVVARATARADELTAEEYREGGRLLAAKVARLRPRWLAVVGVTAYRAAFDDRKARVGPQERTIGDTRVWVLPNPSGLNAHWTAATMAEEFARLRVAADREASDASGVSGAVGGAADEVAPPVRAAEPR
ncbi:G/U mismatch-specific DNA glycosylase [Streptomyces longwoodensis]|uniref:G/U mismatch-specific DNA glycosylase n=1 Tax=Streptomyces longwoodensis TaxID=68231 RepID=UPI002DDBFED6|nr:G/U mismatch-specific DNA glycosylase [Streptomyces longwoodensis]WRY87270.1 G/U mismatch-specific DNA glycosylase [Streptomyces longwoodensis]WTI48334.1 G/U mismatch-specific DNA glycosylase [Streptomyces longwoodensis]WUC74618.1 G/U mismatch-specific DNA glycosylase [Streptomyces longwoodensis]